MLEKELLSLQSSLNKHLTKIAEFHDFKQKEKEILENTRTIEQNIEGRKNKLAELHDKLEKIELKNKIKEKLELLSDEEEITSGYARLRKKYGELEDKKGTNLIRRLYKERHKLTMANEKLKEIDARIAQICESLTHYGISIQSKRLIRGDYSELNRLNREMRPQRRQETVKLRMIDEMIELFRRYLGNEVVPLLNKPVREVVAGLLRLKVKSLSDRIFALLTALNSTMAEKKHAVMTFNKSQEKISMLSQKTKDLEDIGDIRNSFVKAEKKYLDLQIALEEGRTKLLSQWKPLRSIDGEPSDIRNKVHELEVRGRIEETLKSKFEQNLSLLRENAARKPKHEKKKKRLQGLYERISHMREYVFQWIKIVEDPALAKEQFDSVGEEPGFGLSDYQKFARAVGEYLGNQFEPVAFDYKLHNIKFFDIEKSTFTTQEDRQIPINKLSQGQSKITTLTGSFKKMDPNKKKIVLIDEIADLDPENLKMVKATLKKKFAEGSLLLAVLVRPPRESSSKIIDIKGWG